jgi:hypothetical protein
MNIHSPLEQLPLLDIRLKPSIHLANLPNFHIRASASVALNQVSSNDIGLLNQARSHSNVPGSILRVLCFGFACSCDCVSFNGIGVTLQVSESICAIDWLAERAFTLGMNDEFGNEFLDPSPESNGKSLAD